MLNLIHSHKPEKLVDIESVKSISGVKNIQTNYSTYLSDESKTSGVADYLFFPNNEEDVLSVINYLHDEKTSIYISAARTGIVGSAVPLSGAIISTERMDNILGIGYDDEKAQFFIRLEPGVTLKDLNERLKKKNFTQISNLTDNAIEKFRNLKETLYYPVDPTEMSATIGGTVATNASGAKTFKYGPTRKWIRRLKIALTNGEYIDIIRGQHFASNEGELIIESSEHFQKRIKLPDYQFNTDVKNTAGIYIAPNMDLIDLFIGNEGLFGIITEVEVWLTEKYPVISNVVFFPEECKALDFVENLRKNHKVHPEFIEYFSSEALDLIRKVQNQNPSFVNMPKLPPEDISGVFFDIPYNEDTILHDFLIIQDLVEKCGSSIDKSWSSYENRDFIRFKHFRHVLPESVNKIIAEIKRKYPDIHKLSTDISVPDNSLREMMEYYRTCLDEENLQFVIFGHIGNNHLHINIIPKNLNELETAESIYYKFAVKAVELGGSISAEHGIGRIKKKFLKVMYTQNQINEMRLLKQQLDPDSSLNCGNVFDIIDINNPINGEDKTMEE